MQLYNTRILVVYFSDLHFSFCTHQNIKRSSFQTSTLQHIGFLFYRFQKFNFSKFKKFPVSPNPFSLKLQFSEVSTFGRTSFSATLLLGAYCNNLIDFNNLNWMLYITDSCTHMVLCQSLHEIVVRCGWRCAGYRSSLKSLID